MKLRKEVFSWDNTNLFTKQQYHKLQLAFILTFMLKYPLRRDLATVNYLNKEDEANTLDVKAQTITFTKYKTVKHYGPKTYSLTRDQWKLFSWIRR